MLLSGCVEKIPAETVPATEVAATEASTEAPTGVTASAEMPTEAPTEPPAPEKQSATFLACGDNMVFYGNVLDADDQPGDRKYNFAPIYKNVRDMIEAADVAMINQETLMSDKHEFSYYPRFNSPREMGLDLIDVGFDVICIANNHMMDKDEEGLLSTIDFWEEQPVTLIGAQRAQSERTNITLLEKNGITVALLAYTYGTNIYSITEGSTLYIPILEENTVKTQLKQARELADVVVVNVHWGEEYTFIPNDYQRSYARIMTEAGADVIIGHHPHVIQPIEWLTASDGSKTLCAYSLGNFVAEQANDCNMLGGMLTFNAVKSEGATEITDVVFHPTVYYFNYYFRNNRVYPLDEFTPELAKSHGISYYGNSITIDGVKKYLSDTIDKEFLAK